MGYYSNSKADVGKQVKVGPNTVGTGKRGVPAAVALMGKDKVIPALEDPEKSKPAGGGSRLNGGPDDIGKRRIEKAYFKSSPNSKKAPKS